jgi:hypothetical protein
LLFLQSWNVTSHANPSLFLQSWNNVTSRTRKTVAVVDDVMRSFCILIEESNAKKSYRSRLPYCRLHYFLSATFFRGHKTGIAYQYSIYRISHLVSTPRQRKSEYISALIIRKLLFIMRARNNSREEDEAWTEESSPYGSTTRSSNGNGHTALVQNLEDSRPKPKGPGPNLPSLAVPGRPRRRKLKGDGDSKTSSRRKRSQPGTSVWYRFYLNNVQPNIFSNMNPQNANANHASLLLAVLLWYSLGVISISTSKLLLTPSQYNPHNPQYYRHVGGVAPLVLTVQQLLIGITFLRFLIGIKFLNSPGLQPWLSLCANNQTEIVSPRYHHHRGHREDNTR